MDAKVYKFFFQTAQSIKIGLGINNFEAFKKKQKRRFYRLIYRKKYSTDEIIGVMEEMGMKKGSIVFIHSSMTEFYNFTGKAEEIIMGIVNVIGDEGTLLMPAYPNSKLPQKSKDNVEFDVLTTPSGAGYLTEIFRKFPGVKRSIHIQQSVCAYGKLADYFTSDHHLSITAWDEHSPYYRMSQFNTLVFSFGLKYFLGTMIHCTESILRSRYKYFQLFFTKEAIYKYRDIEGRVGEHFYLTNDVARRRSKKRILKKYFEKNQFQVKHLSNLRIEMVDAKYTLDLFLNLANNGITMYSIPSPKKYKNNSGFFTLADLS